MINVINSIHSISYITVSRTFNQITSKILKVTSSPSTPYNYSTVSYACIHLLNMRIDNDLHTRQVCAPSLSAP